MQAADRVFSCLSVSREWVNSEYRSLCTRHEDKDKNSAFVEPEKSIEDDNGVYSKGIIGVRKRTEGITQKGGCAFVLLNFPVAVTKTPDKEHLRKKKFFGEFKKEHGPLR